MKLISDPDLYSIDYTCLATRFVTQTDVDISYHHEETLPGAWITKEIRVKSIWINKLIQISHLIGWQHHHSQSEAMLEKRVK